MGAFQLLSSATPSRLIEESSDDSKLAMIESGVVRSLCDLIQENANIESPQLRRNSLAVTSLEVSLSPKGRPVVATKRNGSANGAPSTGIGYGTGSTRSQWSIERTLAEKLAQEEQLTLLMCALSVFLWGRNVGTRVVRMVEALSSEGGEGVEGEGGGWGIE